MVASWLAMEISWTPPGFFGRCSMEISFRNVGTSAEVLPFSNRKRDAERCGLEVVGPDGRVLEAEPGLMVRPRRDVVAEHTILPGRTWRYKLVGRYAHGRLEFKGAGYVLQRGERYQLRFRYMGVDSNVVVWVAG